MDTVYVLLYVYYDTTEVRGVFLTEEGARAHADQIGMDPRRTEVEQQTFHQA